MIVGQVLQAGQGQIPSRQAQIKAGIPKEVSSETINKVCASGLRASVLLDQAIRTGDVQVGVGGGMESMSKAPYLMPQGRFGYRMGDAKMLDAMVHDGLTNPFSGKQMFVEATEVGDELEMTRADLDRWALRSHELRAEGDRRRAHVGGDRGGHDPQQKKPDSPTIVEIDEGPRRDILAGGARQAARAGGQGGLAHGRQLAGRQRRRRGAGARLRRVGAPPTTRSRSGRSSPTPRAPTTSPTSRRPPPRAARKALEKAGLQPGDIDLWEINEAFASVTLNSIRMLGIDEDRVNVNGGAVALGHPIGASGARILGSLLLELRRRGGGLGCAAICSGGGQGDALILRV